MTRPTHSAVAKAERAVLRAATSKDRVNAWEASAAALAQVFSGSLRHWVIQQRGMVSCIRKIVIPHLERQSEEEFLAARRAAKAKARKEGKAKR